MPPPSPDPATALPRNEGELLQRRPPGHEDGAFPRRLLLPGERILFETRPTPTRQLGWAVAIIGFLFAAAAVSTAVALILSVAPGYAGAAVAESFVFLGVPSTLVWGAVLAGLLRSRRRSAYALTNRRVLVVRGFWSSEFLFADWGQVERLYMPPGESASVVFEFVPQASVSEGATRSRRIRWTSLRSGQRTYDFAQLAFTVEATRSATQTRELRKRTDLLTRRVPCAYCGNLVAFDRESSDARTCPRCSAPLPVSSLEALPPSPAPSEEPGDLPYLRPVVHLARSAIDWFRLVPVAWGLLLVLITVVLATVPGTASGSAASVAIAAALAFVAVAVVGLVLWAQTTRKWATVVRTLRQSLPDGSPVRDRALRPLRARLAVAVAGYVASVVLLVGTIVAAEALLAVTSVGSGASPDGQLTVAGLLFATIAAIVIGQAALLDSLPAVARGSEIPAIDQALSNGRRTALLALVAGLWPPSVIVYLLGTGLTDGTAALWILLGTVGPFGVGLGLSRTSAALDEWLAHADDVLTRVDEPRWKTADLPNSILAGDARAATRLGSRFAPRSARQGWRTGVPAWKAVAIVAAVSVAALVLVSSAGWLSPWLDHVTPASGAAPPAVPPPFTIAPAGSTWAIPGGHYEYESFRVNTTAQLSGSFNASAPVIGYVMDSLDYTRWQIVGSVVSDQYATGNVTTGSLHMTLGFSDRWYVIVENESPSAGVTVAWSTGCVVVFGA